MTANPQTTVRVPGKLLEKAKIEVARTPGLKLNDLWVRGMQLALEESKVKRQEAGAK
jgi:hypothetical protein